MAKIRRRGIVSGSMTRRTSFKYGWNRNMFCICSSGSRRVSATTMELSFGYRGWFVNMRLSALISLVEPMESFWRVGA